MLWQEKHVRIVENKHFGIKEIEWFVLVADIPLPFHLIKEWEERGENVLFVENIRGLMVGVIIVDHTNNTIGINLNGLKRRQTQWLV